MPPADGSAHLEPFQTACCGHVASARARLARSAIWRMALYRDISYASCSAEMRRLAMRRPDLVTLSTTQALYGLPTAGECRDPSGVRAPCHNFVLEITNRTSLHEHKERPEVLILGALHGDERVGPATALALGQWLVLRYDRDPWVRRLVDTRTILVMPMPNAIGVELATRDELGVDPNRDFPYDQHPSKCMATVTARSINEVYRARLLQLVITFHGGMQAIGYNWGAFPYYHGRPRRSPDDVSQREIASQMSRFAGSGNVRGNRPYPTSTMNDLVYPVHGGLEDWGYGASWDTAYVKPCTPRSYGGYPASRSSSYPDAAARAYTVLVETSDVKGPPARTFGGEDGVYAPGSSTDGHVPRNVRLALAGIDLVAPSVVARIAASPSDNRGAGSDEGLAADAVRAGACVALEWVVWGAVRVEGSSPMCRQPPATEWTACGDSQSGDGVWGGSSSPFRPFTFRGCARVPESAAGLLELAVSATVDTTWARAPVGRPYSPENSQPQSHLARARADGYAASNNGHTVHGHTAWLSEPLQVHVGASGSDASTESETLAERGSRSNRSLRLLRRRWSA